MRRGSPESTIRSDRPASASSPERGATSNAVLIAELRRAVATVPVAHPIDSFIAVNPLADLEQLPIDVALDQAVERYGQRAIISLDTLGSLLRSDDVSDDDLDHAAKEVVGITAEQWGSVITEGVRLGDLVRSFVVEAPDEDPSTQAATRLADVDRRFGTTLCSALDAHVARWCARFTDTSQARWSMPGSEEGLYRSWRRLAPQDRTLPRSVRRGLRSWPVDPVDAIWLALHELGVRPGERIAYFSGHLASLPGWSGYLRYLAEHGDDHLMDLLALRLSLEVQLVLGHDDLDSGDGAWGSDLSHTAPSEGDHTSRSEWVLATHSIDPADVSSSAMVLLNEVLSRFGPSQRRMTMIAALERQYRRNLLGSMERPATTTKVTDIQAVFCIDPRSEGLRRHLESEGSVMTEGFAGFFAVPMASRGLEGDASRAQCPAIVSPQFVIEERPTLGSLEEAARSVRGSRVITGSREAFAGAKENPLGQLALAEAAGWWMGPFSVLRSIAPRWWERTTGRLADAVAPPPTTEMAVDPVLGIEEQVLMAKVMMTTVGIASSLRPLVIVCGHGSTTTNNAYASSLDCGACGGHRGGPNSRAMVAMLNNPDVRLGLRAHGIEVPEETWFVAAEHDTATDHVTVLDRHLVPSSHLELLATFEDRCASASAALSRERCRVLPGAAPETSDGASEVARRSADWAQVFPEWGLAGNAAFIAGPRSMTQGIDLGYRTFLHSYDQSSDEKGDALETILTAPVIVAQWISSQYLFSSLMPEIFGAGTKTVHNVVGGGIGVLSGPAGDLRLGLPWQSVGIGDELLHAPRRLLVIIEVPRSRVDEVLGRNPSVRRLVENGWISMVVRESASAPWHRLVDGRWIQEFETVEEG